MERSQIAALIKKNNEVKLDENKNNLLHLIAQKHTVENAIAQIAVNEKKTINQVRSEIEVMIQK